MDKNSKWQFSSGFMADNFKHCSILLKQKEGIICCDLHFEIYGTVVKNCQPNFPDRNTKNALAQKSDIIIGQCLWWEADNAIEQNLVKRSSTSVTIYFCVLYPYKVQGRMNHFHKFVSLSKWMSKC